MEEKQVIDLEEKELLKLMMIQSNIDAYDCLFKSYIDRTIKEATLSDVEFKRFLTLYSKELIKKNAVLTEVLETHVGTKFDLINYSVIVNFDEGTMTVERVRKRV